MRPNIVHQATKLTTTHGHHLDVDGHLMSLTTIIDLMMASNEIHREKERK